MNYLKTVFKKKLGSLAFSIFFFVFKFLTYSQEIVVSELFNSSSASNEWTELVQINDNYDLRNYSFGDNNSSIANWQLAVNFRNIPFWNNIRSGTIIVINSTSTSSSDINPADGYLELGAQDANYFNGGSPDFAALGDYVRILNSSSIFVHGLGWANSAGVDWSVQISGNKALMLNSALVSGESAFVCPGLDIVDYYGDCTPNCFLLGSIKTTKSSINTKGLPNICVASATGNSTFWKTLREPAISNQNYNQTVSGASFTLTFTGGVDLNPSDNTQGYLVLMNTTNSFVDPQDGTTYSNGSIIGTATVVSNFDNITSSASMGINVTSVDGINYYKIYFYRYGTDDLNGNSYNIARGRAYQTTNNVVINIGINVPLPLILINFHGESEHENNILKWQTINESNFKEFRIQRSKNGIDFNEIGIVESKKEKLSNYYSFSDQNSDNSYFYRLKQLDINGDFFYSPTIFIKNIFPSKKWKIYPNPFSTSLTIEPNFFNFLELSIQNLDGKTIWSYSFLDYFPLLFIEPKLDKGIHFLHLQADFEFKTFKIFKLE